MKCKTLIPGFPRIGERRELKKALEKYWTGKTPLIELEHKSSALRERHWRLQQEKGIDLISCNDFSWYDSMLDTIVLLNAIPERFRDISDSTARYFAMARGTENAVAMEMTKWFNTNYHYIVPELDDHLPFSLNASKILSEYDEAREVGIAPKINLIGPLTFLGLSRTTTDGGDPYRYYDRVLPVYLELMRRLSELDSCVYVQIDEPIFVKDPSRQSLDLLRACYEQLASESERLRLIVTTYFEHSNEAAMLLAETPVWGLGLDFVHGMRNLDALDRLRDKVLIAGIVDGRNIWRNDLEASLERLAAIEQFVPKERIVLSTSCSLLHVPYSLEHEPESEVKPWLAFACEKVDEVALLSHVFHGPEPSDTDRRLLEQNLAILRERTASPLVTDPDVTSRMDRLDKTARDGNAPERRALQQERLQLPPLPTTTIGSFPQTPELRKLRSAFKKQALTEEQYEEGLKQYIKECVAFQEEIGLDVLVHGEPERNDMVEYFGEMLNGFHFTRNGWVQSYGSRCVKPPIIYGDVSRPAPMTVKWIRYAHRQTSKPMKGMLTGPVTILNWSFVRDDKARADVSKQLALALGDEIADLQNAGISIIQVDEAAFKEGYPLRTADISGYERWAVANFKLAVSTAEKTTQIHTHMCYSEFNDIIKTLEAMDADVITIETARSGNVLLESFQTAGYANQVGPGVYDIHSPRVPSVEEFVEQIRVRMDVLPIEQLWVNPDCGLKTRAWEEVRPALRNMAQAVTRIRACL
jgi:5-methyltetrahydropteroyltriglutamate--homocysteine methyltransferase